MDARADKGTVFPAALEQPALARMADGTTVDLATLQGEAVFKLDDIRVEQLGWLSAWRTVEYILVNQKDWLVAVCVE